MRTPVDVHLVILIIPIETPPGFTDGEVVLSVGLHQVSEGLRSQAVLFYLNQQLLVDLPGDVGPGLHPLVVLILPGGVGVHPFT